MTVTEIKSKRYDQIMEFLGSKGQIRAGMFEEAGGVTYEDGTTVLEAATDAEFGIGQPMRSWLRGWFDERKSQIESMITRQVRTAAREGKDLEWALDRVAVWAQADIQKRIANGIEPPNHPETVARKGSSTPLIDSGLLRSMIVAKFEAA